MFKCTKCGETKPREEFYKNGNTKKGVTSRCRLCILPNKGEKLMTIPINEKFNFLTVISEGERKRMKHKNTITVSRTVNCLCDCGNMIYNKRLCHIKSLKIQSCGCNLTTNPNSNNYVDIIRGIIGERKTPTWWTYVGMRKRCLLTTHNWYEKTMSFNYS